MNRAGSSRRRLTGAPTYEQRYGYSRGIVEDPFIFISGTTALDYLTHDVEGDVLEQTRRAWRHVAGALGQVESGLDEIVRASIMITEEADPADVLAVSRDILRDARSGAETGEQEPLPALTLIVVRQLFNPRMRVAIEVTAMWRGYRFGR